MDFEPVRQKLLDAGFKEKLPLNFVKFQCLDGGLTLSSELSYSLQDDGSYIWEQTVTAMNEETFKSAEVCQMSTMSGIEDYEYIKDLFKEQADEVFHTMKYGLSADEEKRPLWLTFLEHFANGFMSGL